MRRERLCLLGLVIGEKAFNREAFRSTMQNLWRLQGRVDFLEVGNNLFVVEFQDKLDLLKVLVGRPWSFDRNLFCLTSYD